MKQLIFTQNPWLCIRFVQWCVYYEPKIVLSGTELSLFVYSNIRFVKSCANLDSPLRSAAGPVLYQPHLIGLTEIRCLDLGEILRPQLLSPLPSPQTRLRWRNCIYFITICSSGKSASEPLWFLRWSLIKLAGHASGILLAALPVLSWASVDPSNR